MKYDLFLVTKTYKFFFLQWVRGRAAGRPPQTVVCVCSTSTYDKLLLAGVPQTGAVLEQQATCHGLHNATQRLAGRQRRAR